MCFKLPVHHNPLHLDPNGLQLSQVATYERRIRAGIERVWENVLDWEHLPHLHDASFNYCALDEAGDWGWRTWSDSEHRDHIELCIDSDCYVARSYSAGVQKSEIWTTLIAAGTDTDISVEFYMAGVAEADREMAGEFFLRLYSRLWDEDEAMMRERQRRLDEQRETITEIDLGPEDELRATLPRVFQLRCREFALHARGGKLVVVPTICPHLLGPLQPLDEDLSRLRCPWHGYQFDRTSRECVTECVGRCRLPAVPGIDREQGRIIGLFT